MHREAHHSMCDTVAPSRSSTFFPYSSPTTATNHERITIPLSTHFPYANEPIFIKYKASKTKLIENQNCNNNNNIVNDLSSKDIVNSSNNVNGVTSPVNSTPNVKKQNENCNMLMGKGNNVNTLHKYTNTLISQGSNENTTSELVTALRLPIIDWDKYAPNGNI
jgi:hypothetical protein